MNNDLLTEITGICVSYMAANPIIYNEVDKVYYKSLERYYKATQRSKWCNHGLVVNNGIERILYARKLLGIMSEDKEGILRIIKKGWPFIYHKVKEKDRHDLRALTYHYYENTNMQDDDILNIHLVGILTALLLDKDIIEDIIYNRVMSSARKIIEDYSSRNMSVFKELSEKEKEKVLQIRTKLLFKEGKKQSVSYCLSNIEDVKKAVISDFLGNKDDELRDVQLLSKALSEVLRTEGLPMSEIPLDTAVKIDDLNDILASYYLEFNNQNIEEIEKFVMHSTFLKAMVKNYKNIVNLYINDNVDKEIIKTERYKEENKELKQQLREMKRLNSELEKKLQTVENTQKVKKSNEESELKRCKDKINEMSKENISMKKKLNTSELETEKLKKLILELAEPEDGYMSEEDELIIRNVAPVRTNKKCVVFGGNIKWVNTLKNKFPDIPFLSANTFDESILRKVDHVFIATRSMSHSLDFKIKANLPIKNFEVAFVSNGAKLAFQDIYRTIHNEDYIYSENMVAEAVR